MEDRAGQPDPTRVVLVTTKPDRERADELKARVEAKLVELCAVMDECKESEFLVQFQLAVDYRGKNVVGSLALAKHY